MLAAGRISYDPGLILACADDPRCRVKCRGQFGIRVNEAVFGATMFYAMCLSMNGITSSG